MKILGMGVPELLIILVVVLLIFGPKNLPKLGNALGRTVKGLREGIGDGREDGADAVEMVEADAEDEVADEEPVPAKTTKRRVRKVQTTA